MKMIKKPMAKKMAVKKAQSGLTAGSSAAKTAASSSSSTSSSKMKGVTSPEQSNILSKIPAAGAMKKTKTKERSADGNYMAKTVTRETPEGKSSTTKTRRTVQGIIRRAPSVQKYKTGGMKKTSKKK